MWFCWSGALLNSYSYCEIYPTVTLILLAVKLQFRYKRAQIAACNKTTSRLYLRTGFLSSLWSQPTIPTRWWHYRDAQLFPLLQNYKQHLFFLCFSSRIGKLICKTHRLNNLNAFIGFVLWLQSSVMETLLDTSKGKTIQHYLNY